MIAGHIQLRVLQYVVPFPGRSELRVAVGSIEMQISNKHGVCLADSVIFLVVDVNDTLRSVYCVGPPLQWNDQ